MLNYINTLQAAILLGAYQGIPHEIDGVNQAKSRVKALLELGAKPNLPYRKNASIVMSPLRMALEKELCACGGEGKPLSPLLISKGANLTRAERAECGGTNPLCGQRGCPCLYQPTTMIQAIEPIVNAVSELTSKLGRTGRGTVLKILKFQEGGGDGLKAATTVEPISYSVQSWKEILRG